MKPKPPADVHKRELCRALTAGLGRARADAAREFVADPQCLTLVSWTHRFYGTYRDIALDLPGIDRILREPEPTPQDIAEIDSRARWLARLLHIAGDASPVFGRLIAKPQMRLTLREARRYLHNRRGIATEVRALLEAPLIAAWEAGERVLLIGHSLGSVIAYDTLWELSHEAGREGTRGARVDLFMTLGSPLATRSILKGLRGRGRKGRERYPTNIRRWANFAARGEMTALHPELTPEFGAMVELGLLESLEDHTGFYNHFRGDIGLNVHKSYGYLAHPLVAGAIADWLAA
jgi:hypothetical protein